MSKISWMGKPKGIKCCFSIVKLSHDSFIREWSYNRTRDGLGLDCFGKFLAFDANKFLIQV